MDLDLERVKGLLGPNKVTQPIATNQFMQGEKKQVRRPREHVDIMAMMASVDKQHHLAVNTRHLHVQMKEHLSAPTPASAHVQPQPPPPPPPPHRMTISQPPPPPPPPPRAAMAPMAPMAPMTPMTPMTPPSLAASVDSDGYTTAFFEKHTFLALCLFLIDPNIACNRVEVAAETLSCFLRDLGKNLDNEKNLFKTCGFSRRKNSEDVLNNMKALLASNDTDALLLDGSTAAADVITYASKLLMKNVCIVDYEAMVRKDYVSNPLASWVLFKKSEATGAFSMFHNPDNILIGVKIEADLVKMGLLTKLIKEAKASYVNKLGKIMGVSKVELLQKYA
jgi:hypothetical protein